MNNIPYPGLRPFEQSESHIFFGRQTHTNQLMDHLAKTHFLSVTGLSGCGKSSLVRAGLIANLEGGYMINAGSDWHILTMCPGLSPMRALAEALLQAKRDEEPSIGLSQQNQEELEHLTQRFASGGHLELTRILQEFFPASSRRNFLLLVDQFEELFRSKEQSRDDENEFFVKLLLANAEQRDVSIYVVVTIRSDWIGKCAEFRGLPEVINAGQFLVPRLTPKQLRMAIIGPARVMGGDIESPLVERMLKDIENNSDQLPILQHCLMRMWSLAQKRNDPPKIDMSDYQAVGDLQDALSNHAEEAYNDLDEAGKKIAEVMFRCLSEGDRRRPARLSEVAAVAGVSEAEVEKATTVFRRADRCFLRPYGNEKLAADTVLDISHESLIRQWKRLKLWTEQEADSAEMYRRLQQTARLWQDDKAGLWAYPDLDIALKWHEDEEPTPEWARLYGGDFEVVKEFLKVSQETEEQKSRKERELELKLKRRKNLILWLVSVMLIITISLVFWVYGQWEETRKAKTAVENALTEVERAKAGVEHARDEAEDARQIAEEQRQLTEQQKQAALDAEQQARLNSSNFRKMVSAMFGFLLASDQNDEFLNWVERSVSIESLHPAMQLMIEQSEIKAETKQTWLKNLDVMTPEDKLDLLNRLGKEVVRQIQWSEEFFTGEMARKWSGKHNELRSF